MGLFERRSSKAGLEETDQSTHSHRHDSENSSRRPSSHHTFSSLIHPSNTSTSTKTSSSSLQALNEDAVTDARSDPSAASRTSLGRTLSHHSELPAERLATTTKLNKKTDPEYPVYPEQSYASLQTQVYPTRGQPSLRTRSSCPSHTDQTRPRENSHPQGPRTAGNTPISSPGLFTPRRSTPSVGSDEDGRVGSPYLHPTHLQPPKE